MTTKASHPLIMYLAPCAGAHEHDYAASNHLQNKKNDALMCVIELTESRGGIKMTEANLIDP